MTAILAALAVVTPSSAAELADCERAQGAAQVLRTCSQVLERTDLDPDLRRLLLIRRGLAWLDEDEPKDAVADFTHALKLAPGNLDALTGRARAHAKAGEPAEAAADWTQIIVQLADGPNAPRGTAYLERAANNLAAGDADRALADYAKILEFDPKSIKALIGRANAYVARGDREKALDEFLRAMAIEPENTAPYIARAEAAERWGDTRMAIEDYKFVVKNNSRSAGPYRQALKRLGVDTPP
ncbi:MAG: tetratricopeptide repeat protein [Hyphomicrobium sp.]